jgi:molybdopterin adenylyltransferase
LLVKVNRRVFQKRWPLPPLLSFAKADPMPVRTAILIVAPADLTVEEETLPALTMLLRKSLPSFFLIHQQQGSSQRYWIEETLRRWCDEEEIDLILTVGGTFPASGPSGEEIVPEATSSVLERSVPSLPETMRAYALEEDTTAILDRGVAGIRGRTLLINLPAGPRLPLLFLEVVADLLPSILAHLQPENASTLPLSMPLQEQSAQDPSPSSPSRDHKLDAEEFAQFLQKRGQGKRPTG